MVDQNNDGLHDQDEPSTGEAAAPGAIDVTCADCNAPASEAFYVLNDRTVCPNCVASVRAGLRAGTGTRRLFRSLLAGGAAAVVCAVAWFAIRELTGFEFGLVAIVVGLAVGFAVKWGSRGRGGRRYQLLAVFLTYSAIVVTYVPYVADGLVTAAEESEQEEGPGNARASGTTQPSSDVATTTAEDASQQIGTLKAAFTLALFLLICCVIAFIAPFLEMDIIGLIIIAIGIWEAWKINTRPRADISGPFKMSPGGEAVPIEPPTIGVEPG